MEGLKKNPNLDVLRIVKEYDCDILSRIYDFGAGDGGQVKLLKAFGYKNTIGIDKNISNEHVKQFDVFKYDFSDASNSVKLVLCRYVLHLFNLKEFEKLIEIASNILLHNGFLYIVAFCDEGSVHLRDNDIKLCDLMNKSTEKFDLISIGNLNQIDYEPHLHEHSIVKIILKKRKGESIA